jgi:hypothetical protein
VAVLFTVESSDALSAASGRFFIWSRYLSKLFVVGTTRPLLLILGA